MKGSKQRALITIVSACWDAFNNIYIWFLENQRKPDLHTKIRTRTMHFDLLEDTALAV